MKGEWIRKAKAGTTVVFVHGILSNGEDCWRHKDGAYWPNLLKVEPEFENIGIYVYSYQTGIFSGTYNLSNVVDDLKERFFTIDNVAKSRRVVFVCHSMGGIIVRKFVVERVNDLLDLAIEVGLFLVASPSLGSDYANWIYPLAKFMGHTQVDALRFTQHNAWLNSLDKEFNNLKESHRLKMQGKELIEDKFVIFKKIWRRQVVEPFAGARYFGEPYKVSNSDHFSIAKPINANADQHKLLLAFIKKTTGMEAKSETVAVADNNVPEPFVIDDLGLNGYTNLPKTPIISQMPFGVDEINELSDFYSSQQTLEEVREELTNRNQHERDTSLNKALAAPPFQAFAVPDYFLGRETEYSKVITELNHGQDAVILTGFLGGIGKTALAAYIAAKQRNSYPGGVLWAEVQSSDPELLRQSFIECLGGEAIKQYLAKSTARARETFYQQLLDQRKCLIILDNAETEQVLLGLIPIQVKSKTIITTRNRLKLPNISSTEITVPPLPISSGSHLFKQLVSRTLTPEDEDALELLLLELGGLPLAIRLAAGIVLDLKWGISEYLARFRQSKTLDWLNEPENSSKNVIRKSLQLSYEQLTDEQARTAFRMLNIFPDHQIHFELFRFLASDTQIKSEQIILGLVRRGVMQVDDSLLSKRIIIHPLVKRFAYELSNDEERVKHNVSAGNWYRRLLSCWNEEAQAYKYDTLGSDVNIGFGLSAVHHYREAGRDLESQHVLVAIADQMTLAGQENRLIKEMSFYNTESDLLPWLQLYQAHFLGTHQNHKDQQKAQVQLSALGKSNDLKLASAALISLAKLNLHLSNFEEAERLLHESKKLKEKLNPSDKRGIAYIWNELGHILMHRGANGDSALVLHQKALEIQNKNNDVRGMAYTLRRIASIKLRSLSQPVSALQDLDKAQGYAEAGGMKLVLVLILIEKAEALRRIEYYDNAINILQQAKKVAALCDDSMPMYRVLRRLATIYEQVELYGAALSCLQDCQNALSLEVPDNLSDLNEPFYRVKEKVSKLQCAATVIEGQLASLNKLDNSIQRQSGRRLRRELKRIRQKLGLENAMVRLGKRGSF